jgi:hypothetical protein
VVEPARRAAALPAQIVPAKLFSVGAPLLFRSTATAAAAYAAAAAITVTTGVAITTARRTSTITFSVKHVHQIENFRAKRK